jgi:hypothetical protein
MHRYQVPKYVIFDSEKIFVKILALFESEKLSKKAR